MTIHFATSKVLELDATSHEFLLQYRTESGDTAFIENARIIASPITNFWENSSESQSFTDSTSWKNKVTLTTPSLSSDNYLLLVTAEYTDDYDVGTDNAGDSYLRVTWNGDNLTRGYARGARDVIEPNVLNDYATFELLELSGIHEFALQYHAEGLEDNAYVENARITLVRANDLGGTPQYADNEAGGSIDSASYENVVQLSLTSDGEDYLIMATAVVSTDAGDGDVSTRVLLDGEEIVHPQDVTSADTSDTDWSFFTLENRTLASGSYTITLQQKGGTVSGATYIENARLIAMPK